MSEEQIIEKMAIAACNARRNRCGIADITISKIKDIDPVGWERQISRAEVAYKDSGAEHIPALVEAINDLAEYLQFRAEADGLVGFGDSLDRKADGGCPVEFYSLQRARKVLAALPPELRGE